MKMIFNSSQGQRLIEHLQRFPNPTEWYEDSINENSELKNCFDESMSAIRKEDIDAFSHTYLGQFYKNETPSKFKMELMFSAIDDEIVRRRINLITNGEDLQIINRYFTSIDSDGLIPLSDFGPWPNSMNAPLEKSGHVFHIMPSLPQTNSSFWISQLLKANFWDIAKVRLDPLWITPSEGYCGPMNKATVYCPPFDWERVRNLRKEEHAQFVPDPGSYQAENVSCTDLCWSPSGNEIHFVCEELPSESACDLRASRYMHAIYDKGRDNFIHLDGAVRYYSADELTVRRQMHVRNAGKMGKRIKIFRIDSNLTLTDWEGILASFYFWNKDIENYAGPPIN